MFALPDEEKYPLDSREDVIAAIDYFDKYCSGTKVSPINKRIYASNVLSKTAEYGLAPSEKIATYGSKTLGNQLNYAKNLRKSRVSKEKGEQLEQLFKFAENGTIEKVAFAIMRWDEINNLSQYWGQGLPDPFESILKRINAVERYNVAGTSATKEQLLLLAEDPRRLKSRFSNEFVSRFRSNPIVIFKSAEEEEQIILLRLASTLIDDSTSNVLTVK